MYRQLIQTLCSVLADEKKDSPDLVLVPALAAAPGHGNAAVGHAEPFTYAPMLPEQVQAHELPADETFLDHAEPLLRRVSPRIILAIPPWLPERELSRGWREIPKANGLSPYQPRATPWVSRPKNRPCPEGASQPPTPTLCRPFRARSVRNPIPRALPWAGMSRTVGARETEK